MLANRRRDQICELIKRYGEVETTELAKQFDVSIETIRKDFLFLEKEKKLRKTHGGAVATEEMKPMHGLSDRRKEYFAEKQALAEAAMQHISEGDIIGIDEGSTAIAFAEALKKNFSNLTIVTYSLDVFNILSDHEGFQLILSGGSFMKSERAFCGLQTLDALRNISVQKAFIFPTAISLSFGICGYNDDLLQVQRQLIESATTTYILADSSKFEKRALLRLCDTTENYYYITDGNLDEKTVNLYAQNHIKLYIGGEKI